MPQLNYPSNLVHLNPKQRLDYHHDELLIEIVELINKSHLSLQQLADKAGVSYGTLCRWCSMELHCPRGPTMRKVLYALGKTLMIVDLAGSRSKWN